MKPTWRISSNKGFKSFIGETSGYVLEVVPSYGGKTVSLYNKLSGWEWLEQRDGLSDVLPKDSPKGWAELDRMGWDELFPTIDSCRYPDGIWQGQYIPEHGELWSIEWEGAVDLTGDIPALNLS